MARPFANPKLQALVNKLGPIHFQDVSRLLRALAWNVSTSEKSIYRYSTGLKHHPRVEKRIARLFKMPVAQLRKRLGLPPTPEELHHGCTSTVHRGRKKHGLAAANLHVQEQSLGSNSMGKHRAPGLVQDGSGKTFDKGGLRRYCA